MKHNHRNHPRPLSKPGVLSCDELRFWIKELMTNPDLGWSQHKSALALALGFEKKWGRQTMISKTRQSWIYPSEQAKLSVTLPRVLAGEFEPCIIPKEEGERGYGRQGYRRAERPKRRVRKAKTVMRFELGVGVVFERKAPPMPPARLPDYATWLQNPERWAPKSAKGPR